MENQEELRQQLWEFVYGLLSDEQQAALEVRITSEPDVARAYAEVKQQSDLVAEAATQESPPITLSPPSVDAPRPVDRPTLQTRQGRRHVRGANWLVITAASALVILTALAFLSPGSQLNPIVANRAEKEVGRDLVRTVVTGPSRLSPGVNSYFNISTTSMDESPVASDVFYRVYDTRSGKLRDAGEVSADEFGKSQIVLPANAVSQNARLEISTRRNGQEVSLLETHLWVDPVRRVTYLSTDKPLYRPGEIVMFRSLTLSRFGLRDDQELPVQFEVLDPAGTVIAESKQVGYTDHAVGNGIFPIQPNRPGGKYTLVASSPNGQFPESRREFFVRDYRTPRLKKTLEFTRDSYAPGDSVVADFSAERAEGGSAAGAALRINVTIDGEKIEIATPLATASSEGTYQVKFELPKDIDKGAGTLAVVADDGGTQETIAKTIPINTGKVEVDFYPEGGDLVAELENRVYFHAVDPLGKPVHIQGRLVDEQGNEIVKVESTEKAEGRGAFRFTPKRDSTYKLEITKPAKVKGDFTLPKANAKRLVVLDTRAGVVEPGKPVELDIRATKDMPLVVAAVCRGAAVGQQELKQAGHVSLPLAAAAEGVIRLTVYDYSQSPPEPVAERLVYRRCSRKLNIQVADHSEAYSPGDKVKLSLIATDENGNPVPAAMGVAVVDDSLLNLADDKSPRLATHFLLATEIENPEDLEDANFYLSDKKEAAEALDLLLGTQGWRRFVEVRAAELARRDSNDQTERAVDGNDDQKEVDAEDDEPLRRLLAMDNQAAPPLVFDNLSEIQDDYSEALATFHGARQLDFERAGWFSFMGGVTVLLLIAMSALMRMLSGWRVWGPALAAATACLVIGAFWMNLRIDSQGQVAIADFEEFGQRELVRGDVDENGLGVQNGPVPEKEVAFDIPAIMLEEGFKDGRPLLGVDGFAQELGDLEKADEKNDRWFVQPGVAMFELNQELADERLGFKNRRGPGFDLDGIIADPMFRQQAGKYSGGFGGGMGGMGWGHWRGRSHIGQQIKQAAEAGDMRAVEELVKQYQGYLKQVRFPVREYVHVHKPGKNHDVRSDFRETLFWHPLQIADASGRATIEFELCDSVTTFRVLADGHGGGRLGTGDGKIVSRIPFSLEPKLPLEVNAGDRIDLPLAVNNDTSTDLPVRLTLTHSPLLRLDGQSDRKLHLSAGKRDREFFSLIVDGEIGEADVEFRGVADKFSDGIKKSIRVVPPGFPVAQSYAGRIDGQQDATVVLPENWVAGSLNVTLQAFPSTLADLDKGIDSILREPSGCFEQTSSSNYPNVLALRYMQEHDVADPKFTKRATDLLKKGYGKLVSFECSKKGYEWFGGDPGHEALTAYGLMEFQDMKGVWDVDPKMVERTARWLLDRRDGKGGFQRNARALDTFGQAPQDITNAYIIWALTEAKQDGIEAEVRHVIELAELSDDPYLIALAASAAANAGDAAAERLMTRLAELQQDDGHLDAKNGSITRSGGLSLKVETTALAALAWLKSDAQTGHANKAIQWITKQRQGSGGFGSTQATILALKALIQHASVNRKAMNDGELILRVDGQEVGRQAFKADVRQTIALNGVHQHLHAGGNELSIQLTGDNQMPYAIDVSYRTRKPVSSNLCPLRLETKLGNENVKAGDTVDLAVRLSNKSGEGQPMTIAIVGIPAGLEPRHEQLEELRKAGEFDFYEVNGRELVFYWRSLGPDVKDEKQIAFNLDLIVEIPGKYTGPASRTYLYYTAENKHWVEPLEVLIERN